MSDMKSSLARLQKHNKERDERASATPWEHPEPLKEWEASGLACMVLGSMSINGYVVVPEGHPFHAVHYGDCPQDCGDDWCNHTPDSKIDVHGGITFSHLAKCGGWIFGFDTSHAGDASPYWSGGRAWSVSDVVSETELMAKQLAKTAN